MVHVIYKNEEIFKQKNINFFEKYKLKRKGNKNVP